MFEISFPELVILAVVALLVLGPERLPRAAQFAGLWVRRARAHWHAVKMEFERELADEELRKSLQASRDALEDAQRSLQADIDTIDAAARGEDAATPPAPEDSASKVDADADTATPRDDR